ncbi:class I SAM-dependent methyltransferase [Phyllobacterium salinisoli]|uniref:Class I SAM-dependent methyltransferase n=1 Tax=Phyllobacterium salinisoli TaxID=1899321 RepID=A0A368K0S8_9HYPH|nr:class I SAM-dependent methyltransferase [Phyllobacterium salinisoli]RCS22774.1 class I SAM-dependent methyltransferase [Phyllobacterium salinisoli]
MTFNRADFYDTELHRHNEHLRSAFKIGPHDRVLDVGCGAGQSTRDAARIARNGSVLGVDVSEEMLQVARRRSREEGLRNIGFELGDAQTKVLPAAHFDVCISRFGVMFFADPVAAFDNIGQAMRPGARLALMVWQAADRNEWATAIANTLALGSASSGAAAFSLADRAVTTGILTKAGFASVEFAEVHEPVFYGASVDAAYDAVASLFMEQGDPKGTETDGVPQRVRALLNSHMTSDGVLFDSRAWIVTAQKP